jgi:hypothetical protein
MGTFPDCDVKLCDLEISRVIVAGQEVRELLGTPDYVCKFDSITDQITILTILFLKLFSHYASSGNSPLRTHHVICRYLVDIITLILFFISNLT